MAVARSALLMASSAPETTSSRLDGGETYLFSLDEVRMCAERQTLGLSFGLEIPDKCLLPFGSRRSDIAHLPDLTFLARPRRNCKLPPALQPTWPFRPIANIDDLG